MMLFKPYRLIFFQFLFLIVLFTGCQSENEVNFNSNSESEPASISYLALGDSYTIGTGISEENNYPNQLTESLVSSNFTVSELEIIAVNGWTTTDLKVGIEQEKPDSTFDLVSLLIGVNNQYQGLDIELYQNEFRELLEQSIAFAQGDTRRVFVLSIPNYGVTPFAQSRDTAAIRQEIAIYNEIAENISVEYDIPFIDITPISELAADDTDLLASDNLHPSAEMYGLWVEEMLPTIKQILNE
ncbi:MAG: SGNH/GDSL hydrolase family protein [Gracilimonas sp.]